MSQAVGRIHELEVLPQGELLSDLAAEPRKGLVDGFSQDLHIFYRLPSPPAVVQLNTHQNHALAKS
jgi:hypothetical protein